MSIYSFLRKYLRSFVAGVLFPMDLRGSYKDIPKGPVLLCANHLSGIDVILLAASTERQIRFMAKKELISIPVFGGFLKTLGAFPVDRAGMDVGAIKKAITLLSEGELVGIFPQGTRCAGVHPSKTKAKLHHGAAMMAIRAKATIVPVAIATGGYKIRPFKKVSVIYGKPITYEEYSALDRDLNGYAEITEYVFDRICEMTE